MAKIYLPNPAAPDGPDFLIIANNTVPWARREAVFDSIKTGTKQKRAALVGATLLLRPEEAVKGLRCMRNDLPTPMFDFLLRATRHPQRTPWQRVKPPNHKTGYNAPPAWFLVMSSCGKPYFRRVTVTKRYSYFNIRQTNDDHDNPKYVADKTLSSIKQTRLMTGLAGLALLEEAAARNKDFARFFNAHLPPEYLTNYKAEQVGIFLVGNNPDER
jgi:hypothetical protein